MKILKLPICSDFDSFETTGPNGMYTANINRQGAAIECYIGLDKDACVRWNNFNLTINAYQGVLVRKDDYKRDFLNQRN